MRYRTTLHAGLALVAAASLCATARAADDEFVLQAGTVVTVDGDVHADGASVFVSGGTIQEVRAGYVNPWGAEVFAHHDSWLLPGMVEAESQGGLERQNEQAPNTPFVSVLDGLDPLSPYFEDLLRDGVTTVFVVPGDQTLLGGQGLVLKPVGRTAEEMIVRRDAGLKIALSPRNGTSRMAQLAELRRAFTGARTSERRAVASNPDDPDRSPTVEALSELLGGRLPAVLACDRTIDVENALSLMDEHGFKGFVRLGAAAHDALPLLVERGVPCILPSDLEPLDRDPETGRERRLQMVRLCKDAGQPVVLQANEGVSYGARSLWYQAALAVSQGLTRDEAFEAVTLAPANVLGVGDRVGSIAKGKDANVVLWSGDPMDPASHVLHVWIEGDHVYERATDRKLQRLLDGLQLGRKDADSAPGSEGDE